MTLDVDYIIHTSGDPIVFIFIPQGPVTSKVMTCEIVWEKSSIVNFCDALNFDFTWMGPVVDVQEFLVVPPYRSSLSGPGLSNAKVAGCIGSFLNLILSQVVHQTSPNSCMHVSTH